MFTSQYRNNSQSDRLWAVIALALFLVAFLFMFCQASNASQDEVGHHVATAAPIIVSGGDTYEPFHFISDNSPSGFDVDLIQAVARVMGLDIAVQLKPWRDVRAGLEDGSVDLHIGMTISDKRTELYDFSAPYLSQQYKIFIRSGTEDISSEQDLYGRRIIVQQSGVMAGYIEDKNYTDQFIYAKNANEAMRKLAAGEGDCCLMSEYRGLHVIQSLGLRNLERVGQPVYQTYYGFAATPGQKGLILRLNQGLAILKQSGEYDRIYDDWFGVLEPNRLTTWQIVKYASWIVFPLLIGITGASLWSWSLRRQVISQTSELLTARDQAEAASEAKSRFLATMSHEIRTPLNGVVGMAEILWSSELNNQQKEQVYTISQSAVALKGIITDILDFSKIEAGERSLEQVNFSMRRLVNDTLAMVTPAAEAKGLTLKFVPVTHMPDQVFGDRVALRQVLLNLLSNAVKFTNYGYVAMDVSCKNLSGSQLKLKIKIEDTGIGIMPGDSEGLFDAFTQVDSTTTRRYGGTGLGLAICKNLIDIMGGTISFSAREEGGTIFEIGLVLEQNKESNSVCDNEPERLISADELANWNPVGKTILVVEDNPLNQRVIALMLNKLGFKMCLACNGLEAVESCRENKFHAILMDCQMPEMDGFEATKAIRSLEPADIRTPIIALTAGAFEVDRKKCLATGMDDYLTKPVDGQKLEHVLQYWLLNSQKNTLNLQS